MQADPLQHLRDIHLPAEPSWWPPAPGWWLLLVVLLIGAHTLWRLWRRRRWNQAPLQHAMRLYLAEYDQFTSGTVDTATYVNRTNEILKRALIHVRHTPGARQASGTPWLSLLDQISGTHDFSDGPGQVLGDRRFAPHPDLDAAGFHRSVQGLLKALRA